MEGLEDKLREFEDFLRTTLEEVQTWRQAMATIIENRQTDTEAFPEWPAPAPLSDSLRRKA